MSAPAKFMFDVDFAAASRPARTISPAELAARAAEAEAEGFRKGYAAAEIQAASDNARHAAAAFAQIGAALTQIAAGLGRVEGKLEADAVEVAVAVARQLSPALIAREPFAEIAALATECLRNLTAAPHVAIRVSDTLYATASERLADIARQAGFDGRLVVLGEPEIGPGDCRIEWADGGAVRDRAAIEAAIAATVGRYVAARRGDRIGHSGEQA